MFSKAARKDLRIGMLYLPLQICSLDFWGIENNHILDLILVEHVNFELILGRSLTLKLSVCMNLDRYFRDIKHLTLKIF